jgi:hypothetical protein
MLEIDNWLNQTRGFSSKKFTCGFCDALIGSNQGYAMQHSNTKIYLCPNCGKPTFFDESDHQFPAPIFGNHVENLPENIEFLYNEARWCTKDNAFTASVLTCRKLLMNIAVEKGASIGLKFIEYVEYLSSKNFIPPDGKEWVDRIRQRGNEANHEIVLMRKEDAEELIIFVEMLLKFIYEFPARVKSP